ncbi:uncharacterized protein TNCV_4519501 [Trichonephila clavipes]|nr:uncharacterized protein TNCV_4519501 [Trichonephila clavipes]
MPTEKIPRHRIRAHYEHLSEFERGRIIGLKRGGLANRRIARHMSRSDAAIRRCWKEARMGGQWQISASWGTSFIVINHQTNGPHTSVHHDHSQTADRAKFTFVSTPTPSIVFGDESRFHLCPDDHRRRVWRRPGQRADPAFTIERHAGPQPGVMVWGTVSFETSE